MPASFLGPDDDIFCYSGLTPIILSGWDDGASGGGATDILDETNANILDESGGNIADET